MGKGTGCVPSKWSKTPNIEDVNDEDDVINNYNIPSTVQEEQHVNVGTPPKDLNHVKLPNIVIRMPPPVVENVKVFIVFYSTYGHVLTMAKKVKEGVDSVEGVHGYLFQVAETLSDDVLEKMKAPAKDTTIPTIFAQDLASADAIIFGFPTRYGSMAAQMKAFFDSTGALWKGQALAGKPAGIFVSTGTQGGGQETTAMTAITQLVHHGMLYVPIGYTFGAGMFKLDECQGGSPYGAGTLAAGNGSRSPIETELAMAKHQGQLTANVAKLLARN